MKKEVLFIVSNNILRDIAILEKYSPVKEYEPYIEVRGFSDTGYNSHLLILSQNGSTNWADICKKHDINLMKSFTTSQIKPFYVLVTKCSKFCPQNKIFIGKKMQVMLDPINNSYYKIYPPSYIQKLCNSDGNYTRKGNTYGLAVDDCVILKKDTVQEMVDIEWNNLKKLMPKKAPANLTLDLINKIKGLLQLQ